MELLRIGWKNGLVHFIVLVRIDDCTIDLKQESVREDHELCYNNQISLFALMVVSVCGGGGE